MATVPRQDSPDAPTDEEMRAEIPAIAKPYVMERDKTIARLHFELATIRSIAAARLREIERCEAELKRVVAERDEAKPPLDLWRANDFDEKATMSTECVCSKCGGTVGNPYSLICDTCWCASCDCAACKGAAEPGPEAVAVHPQIEARDSPVADGPIATRFDKMEVSNDAVRRHAIHDPFGNTTAADAMAKASTVLRMRRERSDEHYSIGDAMLDGEILTYVEIAARHTGAVIARLGIAADHLHAAQLATRAHVVPHLRAASEAATAEGDHELAAACTFFAALVNGDLDPAILRYGAAVLRFVQGIG